MASWLRKILCVLGVCGFSASAQAGLLNLAQVPLFVTQTASPLVMLVLSRDHVLYYEAYNNASDLDGDGTLDIRFNPNFEYYGYFNSSRCYSYSSNRSRFNPQEETSGSDYRCSGNRWSGNFLNYLTTSRMDALRKVLYGGFRDEDTQSRTVLERSHVPQDGHSWGMEYKDVATDGYNIADYTPLSLPTGGNRHLFANTTLLIGDGQPLLRVLQNESHRIWEWVSIERPVAGNRLEHGGNGPIVSPTDYVVRVRVCRNGRLEANCQQYPSGHYKPVGLLQKFGENNSMKFGLLTGSYTKNLSGGVLRKTVSAFTDEINPGTGQFTSVVGIAKTIDRLMVTGFSGYYMHESNCGFIFTRSIVEGECRSWGNPLAEMMYEAVRYFAGKGSPTAAYHYGGGGDDGALGLPLPAWQDPYANNNNPYCAKPNLLVISGTSPTYDSDQLPGSAFGSFSGDLSPSLNVSTLANTIWNTEIGASGLYFIGQSGTTYDGAPSAKTVTSFSNIRGLVPEGPTKEGSYYSASVAHYGATNDVNSAEGDQKINSFMVGLASPLPEIKIAVGSNTVTFVPFAKSVAGSGIDGAEGEFQPTNTIVDFYVESLTATTGSFRINFEDAQQGADHDMDAIARFEYVVNPDDTLTITMTSLYAAGGIIQHMGYIISGTTADGTYLEVRDIDTSAGSDVDYFLDTPPGQGPGGTWNDATALPLVATRTFTPSSNPAASILKNPLWYAAKWGGFKDKNANDIPDDASEWDLDGDGVPDTYFSVISPLSLETKLTKALNEILERSSTASASALNSAALTSQSRVYQAIFNTKDWSGQLLSFPLDPNTGDVVTTGSADKGAEWDSGVEITAQNYDTGREIVTYKPSTSRGIPFRWTTSGLNALDSSQMAALNTNPDTSSSDSYGADRLNYLRGKMANPSGITFRSRDSSLGDIVNSQILYVGPPTFPYRDTWPSGSAENTSPYSTFKNDNKNRTKFLVVGANDGMLHVIDASNGREIYAYVPSKVYPLLSQLTSQDYQHLYYVDGSPNAVDAYVSGAWRTMLVGGLNRGGQLIYALDITDPSGFTESNANNIVKWEFTDADDADLGYSYSQPAIVRLADGRWAAIFGNGYNNTETDGNTSTTGNAVLYVVNLVDGSLIKKFDTGVGSSADPLSQGRPNGLNTPAVADVDGDFIADYVYAGDLFGNLWKFDLRSTTASSWAIVPGGNPLFVAKDANNIRQPITSQPNLSRVASHPSYLRVYFGTGKYLEPDDKDINLATTQTFYGVVDDLTNPVTGRSVLLQQHILSEISISGDLYRITSDASLQNAHKGWYMDLQFGNAVTGERQVSNSVLRGNRIIFTTLIPSEDICEFGGDGWLMELTAKDGSRVNEPTLDTNNDGVVDENDLVTYNSAQVAVSGKKSDVGIIPTPGIVSKGDIEYKYTPGSSGNLGVTRESAGAPESRQSWRQLR